MIIAGACTADRSSPQSDRPSSPAEAQAADDEATAQVKIYAAVIRRLITRDHTFGKGRAPFDYVYVVNGPVGDAGHPSGGGLFRPAPESFRPAVIDGIRQRLQDLPPVRFINDGDAVRDGRKGLGGGVKNDGVIISLGPIEHKNGVVHVHNGLWCGALCGQWQTYVLRQSETTWKITGTTGPYIIS